MKTKYIIVLIVLAIIIAGSVAGWFVWENRKIKKLENQQAIEVGELLKNPVYGKLVKIYGRVSYLGERNQFRSEPDCPCFSLYSGDKSLNIWYNSIDVSGIKNGQWVTVIGELKEESPNKEFPDFWAKKVERAL